MMHEQQFRSRPLHVKLSTPQGAKRSATTILSRVGTRSPSVEVNGARREASEEVPNSERQARTLGLMNVPDTVNDARIRALVEPYGKLIKIVLRPDHQGAIVEFADVHEAGKASLELEGQEITPGRKLHIGTVPEMMKQSAEKKSSNGPSQGSSGSSKAKDKPSGLFPVAKPIKRPPQPGARGGKRGGLGVKRATATSTANGQTTTTTTTKTTMTTDSAAPSEGQSTKKSNEDFRAMIQRSRAG